MISLINSGLE